MAKGTGLIGNFKGKVGNTVGYKLSASNNGQTQGIRVYQPIVKNPKTAAQAEQRAKLLAVNATYRALKMVIDRGNEGLPYGNKSRLAWLKSALANFTAPWFDKGAIVSRPELCQLTKGTLGISFIQDASNGSTTMQVTGLLGTEKTIGALSTAILAAYPSLKAGDQITFVTVGTNDNAIGGSVASIVLDAASTEALTEAFVVEEGVISHSSGFALNFAGAIVISREGENGQHLRNNAMLQKLEDYGTTGTTDAEKAAAIASYQSSAATNSDWAEESIQ